MELRVTDEWLRRENGTDDAEEVEAGRQVALCFEQTMYALEMLELGLAYRRAGLIWFPPLCHDGHDY